MLLNIIGDAVDEVDFDWFRMCDSDRCRCSRGRSEYRLSSERAVAGVSLADDAGSPNVWTAGRSGIAGRPKVPDSPGRAMGDAGEDFDIVRTLPFSTVICAAASSSAA